jgi:hypothetical protein
MKLSKLFFCQNKNMFLSYCHYCFTDVAVCQEETARRQTNKTETAV